MAGRGRKRARPGRARPPLCESRAVRSSGWTQLLAMQLTADLNTLTMLKTEALACKLCPGGATTQLHPSS
eukprot:11906408-Alexandrium_andersonii.AAC.1